MKKLLITGGCGFIGSNLVRQLKDTYEVVVLDNLSSGSLSNIDQYGVTIITGDILNEHDLERALDGVDMVVHLAASGSVIDSIANPVNNFRTNVEGTFQVLWKSKEAGIEKLVFASTGGALIGDASPPVSETSLPKPISPYGASKLCGEAYLHAFAKSYDFPAVALRFANVFGPMSSHKKGAVTQFIKCIQRDEPITIYGDGSASRDYLYVDDLCSGILLALEKNVEPGEVMHLASGVETTVLQLAKAIMEISQSSDHPVAFERSRKGEVERNFARFDYANEILGFHPAVALNDGLQQTWDWFNSISG